MNLNDVEKIFDVINRYVFLFDENNTIIFANKEVRQALSSDTIQEYTRFYNELISENEVHNKIELEEYYFIVFNKISHNELDFLALLSHELNTPLTSIIGYVDLLLNNVAGPFNEIQKEFMTIIKNNSDELNVKINQLLDISEYISKKDIPVICEKFNTENFLKEMIGGFITQAEKKKILFDYNIDPNCEFIFNDVKKIRTILSEFILNAVKNMNSQGIIEIKVEYEDATVLFSVKDEGCGIAAEKQQDIFSLFTQVDQTNTRKIEGIGTGLYYIKKIADSLDGKIEVESQKDQGSIFKLIIPKMEEI